MSACHAVVVPPQRTVCGVTLRIALPITVRASDAETPTLITSIDDDEGDCRAALAERPPRRPRRQHSTGRLHRFILPARIRHSADAVFLNAEATSPAAQSLTVGLVITARVREHRHGEATSLFQAHWQLNWRARDNPGDRGAAACYR